MKLKGKTVVITGGGRGIGEAMALECARQGARVAIAARSALELEKVAEKIRAETGTASGVNVLAIPCDVAHPDGVTQLMRTTEERFGPIDGLVCAAGIYGPIGAFEDTPIEEWIRAIDVNLIGTARCVHAVLGNMKKRRSGRIVLMSGGGQGAYTNFSAYVTSKGGIWRMTETLGAEAAPFGVAVNAIAPGAVNTKLLDDLLQAGPEKVGRDVYEKALKQKENGGASAQKAADLTVYLLSDESKGLAGKILSALWDPYREFQDLEGISRSDLYTMRRVVTVSGGTRE